MDITRGIAKHIMLYFDKKINAFIMHILKMFILMYAFDEICHNLFMDTYMDTYVVYASWITTVYSLH